MISLGFKIDGMDDMKSVEKSLKESTIAAGKLAAGVDLVVGALAAMMHTAVDAAVGFQKFNLTTGLSSSELQQWLYTASLANVSASELTESVKALQMAGGIAPAKAIFFDDVQAHVIGAREVGIRAHQYTTAKQLIKDLDGILS